MIKVENLREKKRVFILHGISFRGAHYFETGKTYSLLDNFEFTFTKSKHTPAFTFHFGRDNFESHIFSPQGYIIRDGKIIHADERDSGTRFGVPNKIIKEPKSLEKMEKVIDSNREMHNELWLEDHTCHGFYFSSVSNESTNDPVLYTKKEIFQACQKLNLPIYYMSKEGFRLIRITNDGEFLQREFLNC